MCDKYEQKNSAVFVPHNTVHDREDSKAFMDAGTVRGTMLRYHASTVTVGTVFSTLKLRNRLQSLGYQIK